MLGKIPLESVIDKYTGTHIGKYITVPISLIWYHTLDTINFGIIRFFVLVNKILK